MFACVSVMSIQSLKTSFLVLEFKRKKKNTVFHHSLDLYFHTTFPNQKLLSDTLLLCNIHTKHTAESFLFTSDTFNTGIPLTSKPLKCVCFCLAVCSRVL